MGSTAGRLAVAKQRATYTALVRSGAGPVTAEILCQRFHTELAALGYRVSMIGGDMIWGQDEEPPEAAEILARESCPRCGGGAHRVQVDVSVPSGPDTFVPGALVCDLGSKCPGAQVEIVFLKDGES
jgi:hypothetical protein